MNKKYLYLPLAALALSAMTGCGKEDPAPTVTSLTVSGAKTEFKLEDEFTSEGLVVKANWSDGSQTDVTSSATVNSDYFDNEAVSDYEIVVSAEGKTASYFVNVHPFLLNAVSISLEKDDSAVWGPDFDVEFPTSWGEEEQATWFSSLSVESDNQAVVDLNANAFGRGYIYLDALSEGEATVTFNCDMDDDGEPDDFTPVELLVEVGAKTKYNKFETPSIKSGLGLTDDTLSQMPFFSFLGDFTFFGLQQGQLIYDFSDIANSAAEWELVNEVLAEQAECTLTLLPNGYNIHQFSVDAGEGLYWGLDIVAAKFDTQTGSPTGAETGEIQLFISGDATDPYYKGLTGAEMNEVGPTIAVHPITTLDLPDLPAEDENRVWGPYPFEEVAAENNGVYFQVVPMQGSDLESVEGFEEYVGAYLASFIEKGYTPDIANSDPDNNCYIFKSSDSTHEVEIDYRLDDGHFLSQMSIYIGAYTADPVDFAFDDEELTVSVGTGYQLTTSFNSDYPFVGSEKPTFSITEGSSYAEITAGGYLSAVAEGTVTVEAVSGTYEHTLTVTIADDLTALQKAMLEMYAKVNEVTTYEVDVYSEEAELDLTAESYEDYILMPYTAKGTTPLAIASELIGFSSILCPTGFTVDTQHAEVYNNVVLQIYAYAFDANQDVMIELTAVYGDLSVLTGNPGYAGMTGLLVQWTLSETTDDVYYVAVADSSVTFTAGQTFNADGVTVTAVCFDGTEIPLTAGEDYTVVLCTADETTGQLTRVEDQTAPLAEGTYYEVVVDGEGNMLDYIEITVNPTEE